MRDLTPLLKNSDTGEVHTKTSERFEIIHEDKTFINFLYITNLSVTIEI